MADPYLGEIRMFGGNFAPRGYAFCSGQILKISQNDALFALIGTTYGGDGENTFGLPELRGRIPLHAGHAPGLQNYTLGQLGGVESVTLTTQQLPAHLHIPAAAGGANTTSPSGALLGATSGGNEMYAPAGVIDPVPLAMQTVTPSGGSQPHDNMMPFLAISFIIALQGVYPSRN